jgi:uncharacterized repeat protein (TIGR01451 family)
MQVQVDGGVWRQAMRAGRAGETSRWRLAWPWARGTSSYRFRTRAIDWAGNAGAATPEQTWRALADPSADLSVTQSAAAVAAPGRLLAYRLRVVNAGPATARSTVLVDSLPGHVTALQLEPACREQGFVLVCQLGDLAPGATRDLAVVAQVGVSGAALRLRNVVAVRSEAWDPRPADNRAEAWTQVGDRIFLPKVEQR